MFSRRGDLNLNKKIKKIMILIVALITIIMVTGCVSKGSMIIMEKDQGKEFTVTLINFNSKDTFKMFIDRDCEVQITVSDRKGELGLTIRGSKGSEPYTGNNLKKGTFTVKIGRTDEYAFEIRGKEVSGEIIVKNIGFRKE